MVLNKNIIRAVGVFLSVTVILSATGVLCFADDNSQDGAITTESINIQSDEYSSYLSEYSDAVYSVSEVRKDLGGIELSGQGVDFEIEVAESGFYGIGMSYLATNDQMSAITVGIKIDGEYPYEQMSELEFPRMWRDEYEEPQTDDAGNEFASSQVLSGEYCYNEAFDTAISAGERFSVFLEAGTHSVSILTVSGAIKIDYFKLYSLASKEKYSAVLDEEKFYRGEKIIIEGEAATVKSSYYLIDKTDNSSAAVSPQDSSKSLLNYIGGSDWKNVGDKIIWETPELEEGYYQLGFSYRQNSNIGGKSYRILTVDGEVPFYEAQKIGFSYNDNWQSCFFADEEGNPYLIYLSEGKHEIALTVTSADIAEVRTLLTEAVAKLGTLYVDITKITGETVDIYRDYDLFSQIGNMEERLKEIRQLLNLAGETLLEVTGEKSGSNYSVIMNMLQTVDQMLKNKYESHRYKSTYYSNYCSVSSVLQDLKYSPLDMDKLVLTAVGEDEPFEKVFFSEKIIFSVKRFLKSFTQDYSTVSSSGSENEAITIWVSWGRDQAQALNSLIKRSFTPSENIDVNLKLVNATAVQAVLSGNGPDCFLQMVRSEPVNLALRGVLYDLSQFEDCDEILSRFQDGAETPYRYGNGLYALPDTQGFYMMFYRTDILDEYGLDVPETWDDFKLVAKLLMRNNMSVYMPVTAATDVAQANLGVGSNNIFPSLLLQNGISVYKQDGSATNLLSAEAMEIFCQWTDYYTKLKFPKTLDFYNRFRTGTTPLGIYSYTLYTTLKSAAPEIDGLWGMTQIPGTVTEDGSVDHTVSGSGTGCVILRDSENPEAAWRFLKWWTSAETQQTYSNNLESVLGPVGRVALSNVEALTKLSFDGGELEEILTAWSNVEEIPEYPGSYYVSRSIYQAYWNVVNSNKNPKDMLMLYGKEADDEIIRKQKQYAERG